MVIRKIMNDKKAGRPPLKDESQRREKKVMLTFTNNEYDDLKKYQVLLNQATLTATLLFFIEKGRESVAREFAR
jgi:hypothetical protein